MAERRPLQETSFMTRSQISLGRFSERELHREYSIDEKEGKQTVPKQQPTDPKKRNKTNQLTFAFQVAATSASLAFRMRPSSRPSCAPWVSSCSARRCTGVPPLPSSCSITSSRCGYSGESERRIQKVRLSWFSFVSNEIIGIV